MKSKVLSLLLLISVVLNLFFIKMIWVSVDQTRKQKLLSEEHADQIKSLEKRIAELEKRTLIQGEGFTEMITQFKAQGGFLDWPIPKAGEEFLLYIRKAVNVTRTNGDHTGLCIAQNLKTGSIIALRFDQGHVEENVVCRIYTTRGMHATGYIRDYEMDSLLEKYNIKK